MTATSPDVMLKKESMLQHMGAVDHSVGYKMSWEKVTH